MDDYLVLRFDSPLMSFGGVLVDEHGITERWPGLSLVVGLLGNALGCVHSDDDRLEALQRRVRYAVRRDVDGELLRDFHTVDLGQPHLVDTGWTTRGKKEARAGASGTGTHIRHREYLADSVFTLVLRLDPSDGEPSLEDLENALEFPARPLFLGRKTCLPSVPILVGRVRAGSLRDALGLASVSERAQFDGDESLPAAWPADEVPDCHEGIDRSVVDARDWTNQVHVGSRVVREGRVRLKGGQNV